MCACRELTGAPVAELDAASGRLWKPWETASNRAVDTVEARPLRVRVWRLHRPEIPVVRGHSTGAPVGCPAPLRCLSQPTQC